MPSTDQAQRCQRRELFLANAARAFEPAGAQRQGRLERENAKLESLVGEVALELKGATR